MNGMLIGLGLALAAMVAIPQAAGEADPQNDWMVHMERSTGAWRYVPSEIVLVPGGLVQLMVFGEGQYSLTLDEPAGYDADIATIHGVVRTAEFHAPHQEGTYSFRDKYHPEARGMLTVRSAASGERVIGVIPGGYESRFAPERLDVPAGAEILFTANGTFGHNLQGVDANFSAGDLAPGERATFTAPTAPGEYAFECRFHRDQGMVGVLIVRPTSAPSQPSANLSTDARGEGQSATPGIALPALLGIMFLVAACLRHLRE